VNTLTDQQLLGDYARDRSEAAFGELVRRHVDLTYSVALRLVRDPHLAEDVTESVFVALAQNAARLAGHPVLSGWLHRAARNVAAQTVRSEVRRRAREQEAATMNELLSTPAEASWDPFAQHLDTAMAELDDMDRDAVLLRYFERKSAQEMAGILGISADAAQKRVSRAVEQLRGVFARRGLAVGSAALALMLSSQAVQAAPSGLVPALSTTAPLSGLSAATTAFAGTIPGPASTVLVVTKAAATTVLRKILVTSTLAILAGISIYEAWQVSQLRRQVHALQAQQAAKNGPDSERQLERPLVAGLNPGFSDRPASGPEGIPLNATGVMQPLGTGLAGPGRQPLPAQTQQTMEQMRDQQRQFMASRGDRLLGGGMGNGVSHGTSQIRNTTISTKTVDGATVIVYHDREFPVGKVRGLVTTKVASIQGNEYAAAFDGDHVIWENVPGAAQQCR
jgi:RNA polymerase sigma factor (sigma-70 family)